ncbi:hypothetical protein M0765_013970 [Variovorax sp. S2]|uniref:hypothetical protein n=1 Tax=Variovorax sp. S12S4 TaxID=3029170 RepID=UPI00215C3982|nr:hypothetical protein [Variovorax sp. S12S4]MCR8958794.1 hypothetical protein [Variovorax sp. S12S4]
MTYQASHLPTRKLSERCANCLHAATELQLEIKSAAGAARAASDGTYSQINQGERSMADEKAIAGEVLKSVAPNGRQALLAGHD